MERDPMIVGMTYDLRKDYLERGYKEEDIAEFDSEDTIDQLEKAIKALGHKTQRIGNVFALTAMVAKGDRWDMVFNICEGMGGRSREAQVPAILEAFGIPYTFSDPLVCAATLDKAIAKRLVREAGLATPPYAEVRTAADIDKVKLTYPLFAKPIAEGTGKGIDRNSRIQSPAELRRVCLELLSKYGQPVIVEEFLPGREFTIAIIGNGSASKVIGTMEILIPSCDSGAIYSFEAKEKCETLCTYLHHAPGTVAKDAEALALACHKTLQCRDVSRVDVRCDASGKPCFLEVNPLPGLHPTHSDLPMIATAQGMSYTKLINEILTNALARQKEAKLVTA
jgi:D-alanine-D-alanine ligase